MQVSRTKMEELLVALGVDTARGWDVQKMNQRVNADGGVDRYFDSSIPIADVAVRGLFDEIVAHQKAGNPIEVVVDPEPVAGDDGTFSLVDAPLGESETKPKPAKKQAAKPKPSPKKPVKKVKPKISVNLADPAGVKAALKKPGKKPAAAVKAAAKPKPKAKPKAVPGVVVTSPTKLAWRDRVRYYRKHPLPIPPEGVLRVTYDELLHAGKTGVPVTKDFLLGVLQDKFPDRDVVKMRTTLGNNVPGRLGWKYGVDVVRKKVENGRMGYFVKLK